jgi:hypothetical protein
MPARKQPDNSGDEERFFLRESRDRLYPRGIGITFINKGC